MLPIQPIHSLQQIRLLSDPRRLAILRLLMSAPASLTQLGLALGEHPAWVRHHLKLLESAGLVVLTETRLQAGVLEKIYTACAGGFLLQELLIPADPAHPTLVFSGSHDLAVELLSQQVAKRFHMLSLPVGSLDGLVALRQNLCHFSGCHLLDVSGQYNLPFVHHFFPDRSMRVITLAYREQGLMLAAGNPLSIRDLPDLANEQLTFINRNPGSGTRLWFDRQLQAHRIPAAAIRGYDTCVKEHTECARLIHAKAADAAIGLRAAAARFGLDFIPLFQERYDLVFPAETTATIDPLLDLLQTRTFRQEVEALTGYETSHTGETIQ